MKKQNQLIIYNTDDNKTSIALYAKDGQVWMNQKQLAELFETSTPNISMHVKNILEDKELSANSVVKDYLTTAPLAPIYEHFDRLSDRRPAP